MARTNWRGSRGAQKKTREHTKVLKGSLRLRRYQQETPHALQEANVPLLVPNRRGLLGFSGLAPHSGRSSVPFRRSLFRDWRIPFQPTTPNYEAAALLGEKSPDKTQSIEKKAGSVKQLSKQLSW